MKTNKLIIFGVALVVAGVLATGIAFAHYTTAPSTGYNYGPYSDNTGDWGGCYDGTYGPYGYQLGPEPYNGQPPQGYYSPQSYGRGCWGR